MMKRLSIIILIILVFAASLFIYFKVFNTAKLKKGSEIGHVLLGGLDEIEAEDKLNADIARWQAGDDLVLRSDFETFFISREAFDFHVEESLEELKQVTRRQLNNFYLGKNNIKIPLEVTLIHNDPSVKKIVEKSYIDHEKTLLNASDVVKELREDSVALVYGDKEDIELDHVATVELDLPEGLSNAVLTYAVEELDGQIIPANELLSFNQAVQLPKKMTRSTDELSLLASALYMLSLKTNLDTVSRDTHLRKPSYIESGLDVFVNPMGEQDKIDFILNNPNDFSVRINAAKNDDTLKLSLESTSLEYDYDYEVKELREIEPRTIYRYSKTLAPGESLLIHDGQVGYTGDMYRNSYDKDGNLIEESFINREFSLPTPRIVAVSTEVEEEEEDVQIPLDMIDGAVEDYIEKNDLLPFVDGEDINEQFAKFEEDMEEMIDFYIDELIDSMEIGFDSYFEDLFNVIDITSSGDQALIENEIKRIEELVDETDNAQSKLMYDMLLDLLKEGLGDIEDGDVKEG